MGAELLVRTRGASRKARISMQSPQSEELLKDANGLSRAVAEVLEGWNNRLTPKNPLLSERYMHGQLEVHIHSADRRDWPSILYRAATE